MDFHGKKICRSSLCRQRALIPVALAPLERKMVWMLAHGVSPRIIAERLALGEDNLRACLDSIFAKLAMSGQLGLLAGPESRDRHTNFSQLRKAHRALRNNLDRKNEMHVD